MKKVMLYAYTNLNLGDDLFIKILCNRYPNTKFFLYAPKKYKKFEKEIKNLKVFSSDSFFSRIINLILRKLKFFYFIRKQIAKRTDISVYIGGSLYMQHDNWESSYIDKKHMQFNDSPFLVLGANFGPFNQKQFYERYNKLFKNYYDICFRDSYSYNLFKHYNHVRFSDDIIFQLGIKKRNIKKKNNIIISVIKPSQKCIPCVDDGYYEKIKEISNYFIKNNYTVTLMSFCESEGDEEAVESVIKRIPKIYRYKVERHLYQANIEETLNVIASSSGVVATRFHSMILGWIYDKPVYPIVYSDKMLNVMEDIAFRGFYGDLRNKIHRIHPNEVFESLNTNSMDVSKQVHNSSKHFKKLDELLLTKPIN
ncbi:polysaccharide pyruvyl transferase family protein [Terrilactibacillus tamarindi]|nr:polysaccharide pyruvyl transferase family protein [Terrilactibacillus tamarindi]